MCIKLRKSKKNLETAICLRTIFSMINQLKKKTFARNQTKHSGKPKVFPYIQLFKREGFR